jgi:hypothetical protein
MTELPWPVWDKGHPSPKDVYKVYGEEFLGYLPLPKRLMTLNTRIQHGSKSKHAELTLLGGGSLFPVFCATDRFSSLDLVTFDVEKQSLRARDTLNINTYLMYTKIPLYIQTFHETIRAHPLIRTSPQSQLAVVSLYMFERFVIDDNNGTVNWARYGMSSTWKPLKSLDELPEIG